ncbi:Ig domain protein group 2 domain protein [Clostridium sp. DL-VIII]|uniref:Ig-like domain-containing protein n=1 Tax=Clostridium sp. DL-VIII TaxID=641107 RepID=UPI00023B0721|nr:Ig-like domain-containing protein [Clostridium sp. DL-VIII]EHJ02114.1 Ig domain protein group 2 domain protein [Clostridium sp. DL-VIII]
MAIGKTGTFTATVLPNNASNKGLIWKSNNVKVATVSSSGKLTAVGVGTATITCTASDGSGKSAVCVVTVTNPSTVKVTSVALNTTKLNWVVGKTGTFTATVLPNNATNKAITWKSSNTKVATVSSSGKLTAVGVGTATITCTANDGSGKSATCVVTVQSGNITGTFITKPQVLVKDNDVVLTFKVNQSGTYALKGIEYDSKGETNDSVTWDEHAYKAGDVKEISISDTLAEMEQGKYIVFQITPKDDESSVVKSEKISITKSGEMNVDVSKITTSKSDENIILKANKNFEAGIYVIYAYENNTYDCSVESTKCAGNTSSLKFNDFWDDESITSMQIARVYDINVASDGSATCKVEMSDEFIPSK